LPGKPIRRKQQDRSINEVLFRALSMKAMGLGDYSLATTKKIMGGGRKPNPFFFGVAEPGSA